MMFTLSTKKDGKVAGLGIPSDQSMDWDLHKVGTKRELVARATRTISIRGAPQDVTELKQGGSDDLDCYER